MAEDLKIAMIGGGSSYTPDLAEMLVQRRDDLPVHEWALMDVDANRLKIVGEFTRQVVKEAALPTTVTLTTDLEAAVRDAQFVIACMRVGGSRGRVLDESIPPKHGLVGQETQAPGGLAMGLRQIPAILNIAHTMEGAAAPGAWLIILANPAGMLGEAVHRHSTVRVAGLCNGPTVMRQALEAIYGPENKDMFMLMTGLNHLSFLKVYLGGEDVTLQTIPKLFNWCGENIGWGFVHEMVPQDIMQFSGWIGCGPYVRYYYMYPEIVEEALKGEGGFAEMRAAMVERMPDVFKGVDLSQVHSRAEMVRIVEKRTLELYAKGDKEGSRLMRQTRGGRGYGEAGLSLASAIWNNTNAVHVIDVPNRGSIVGLPADVVVETSCLINRTGAYPLPVPELPKHMLSFLFGAKQYELLAVEAAVTGSYHAALEALVANPMIQSFRRAKATLDELLVAHEPDLPQFSEAIGKLKRGQDPLR